MWAILSLCALSALVGVLWLTKPGFLMRHRSATAEERDLIKPMQETMDKEVPANSYYDPHPACPPVPGKIAMWDLSTHDLTYQPLTWGVRDAFRPIPLEPTDAVTDRVFEAAAVLFVRNSSQPASTRTILRTYTLPGQTPVLAVDTETCFGLIDKSSAFLCGRCFRGDLAEQVPAKQVPYALPPDPIRISKWLSWALSGKGTPPLEGIGSGELYIGDPGGETIRLHHAYDLSRSGDFRDVVLSSEPLSTEVLSSRFWEPDKNGEIEPSLARVPPGAPLLVLATVWVIHRTPVTFDCTGSGYIVHSSLVERGYPNGVVTPELTCRFGEVGDDKLTGMLVLNPVGKQNARMVAEYRFPAPTASK